MKVVLLCAGYATRLYPLTENKPKALLPVGGKPILEHVLDKLAEVPSVGVVYVVTNERFYSDFKGWSEKLSFLWPLEVVSDGTRTNETRLGAIGDLAFLVRKYQVRDDVAVFAGDNLFHSPLAKFFLFAEEHRPYASLGVVDVVERERARRYGIVQTDSEGRITEFHEKPGDPPSTLASTGIYWFARERLNLLDRYIREGHNADRPGDYIRWLVEVDRVYSYPFEGAWFDIGDFASYQEADRSMTKKGTP